MTRIGNITLGAVLVTATLAQPAGAAQTTHIVAPQRVIRSQARQTDLRRLPYSSGFIFSRAVHLGLIHPAVRPFTPASGPNFTCAHAPCVFPNVVAGSGPSPVNETPIAANPKNTSQLLTGANDYNCSSSLQGYFFSSDGGKSWISSCGSLVAGSSSGDGDPIVGFDLNGVAYRGGIDATSNGGGVIVVDHSTDGGKTWSTPITAVTPYFSGGLTDKPWMQIDTAPASPRKNTIYVSTTQFDNSSDSEITVSHSTDGGKTWKQTATGVKQNYPVVNQFSDIATGADGTVYVSFLRCTANGPNGDCGGTKSQMLLVKSTDGGTTWSSTKVIANVTLAPDNGGGFYGTLPNTSERLSDIPSIAMDTSTKPSGGTLYEIDYSYTTYCQVQVAKSRDGGNTWSTPIAIATSGATHDQFFPWINVSPYGGEVAATWLDRRNDPSNLSYETFGGFAKNAGAPFVNIQIGSQLSNPLNDGFGGSFMGDYTGNTFAGAAVFASWTDTRTKQAVDEVGGFISY